MGFDTQYERAYSLNKTTKIGVGLIPCYEKAIANSYTTSLEKGDFTSRSANTAGFNFNSPQPILLVIKNIRLLINLAKISKISAKGSLQKILLLMEK